MAVLYSAILNVYYKYLSIFSLAYILSDFFSVVKKGRSFFRWWMALLVTRLLFLNFTIPSKRHSSIFQWEFWTLPSPISKYHIISIYFSIYSTIDTSSNYFINPRINLLLFFKIKITYIVAATECRRDGWTIFYISQKH